MLKKTTFFIAILSFSFVAAINAAVLKIEITDTELLPVGIWGYQFSFSVDGTYDFETSNLGSGIDTNSINWNTGIDGIVGYGGEGSPHSKLSLTDPLPPLMQRYEQFKNTWQTAAKMPNADVLNIIANDSDLEGNSLKNGLLFELYYPEDVTLTLSTSIFLAMDGMTSMELLPSETVFGAGNNTLAFSSVPIPSSLLLLGGGLLAFFGIRRRQ